MCACSYPLLVYADSVTISGQIQFHRWVLFKRDHSHSWQSYFTTQLIFMSSFCSLLIGMKFSKCRKLISSLCSQTFLFLLLLALFPFLMLSLCLGAKYLAEEKARFQFLTAAQTYTAFGQAKHVSWLQSRSDSCASSVVDGKIQESSVITPGIPRSSIWTSATEGTFCNNIPLTLLYFMLALCLKTKLILHT